jgi:hypothetical protein
MTDLSAQDATPPRWTAGHASARCNLATHPDPAAATESAELSSAAAPTAHEPRSAALHVCGGLRVHADALSDDHGFLMALTPSTQVHCEAAAGARRWQWGGGALCLGGAVGVLASASWLACLLPSVVLLILGAFAWDHYFLRMRHWLVVSDVTQTVTLIYGISPDLGWPAVLRLRDAIELTTTRLPRSLRSSPATTQRRRCRVAGRVTANARLERLPAMDRLPGEIECTLANWRGAPAPAAALDGWPAAAQPEAKRP